MSAVSFDSVSFGYGAVPVLDGLTFAVEPGAALCLFGPSGCGKSTILRLTGGLERLGSGAIQLRGAVVSEGRTHVPPRKRGLAMVFQDLALWPHLTVVAHLDIVLRAEGLSRAVRLTRIAETIAVCRLDGLESRRPPELSGGQQQRLALARALVAQSDILLLDEPFNGLDHALRDHVIALLRDRLSAGAAIIYATHQPDEAEALGGEMLPLGQVRR